MPLLHSLILLLALPALLCQCATPATLAKSSTATPSQLLTYSRVTQRLAAAVPTDITCRPISWKFSVRPSPNINAASWPSGRVEVTTGLLTFVKNEPELAAVLAHEMAHIYARHGPQRVAHTVAALFTLTLTTLPAFARQQEFHADRLSLDLLRRAAYPLQSALQFWQRYAAHRASLGLGQAHWWKAHPPDAERLRRFQQLLLPQ